MTRDLDHDGLGQAITDKALEQPRNAIVPHAPPKPASLLPLTTSKWNTKNLPWRLTSDITAAACASGLVAPLITIIDR